MKLTLILVSVRQNQLSSDFPSKAVSIVKAAYTEAFAMNDASVEIAGGDGNGIDFAIAYDQIPAVPNAASKFRQMVQMVGDQLKNMIPAHLHFEGKGKFIPLSDTKAVKESVPDETFDKEQDGTEFEQLAKQYIAEKPKFKFSQIVLAEDVQREIDEAMVILMNRELLFDKWGLKAVMSPSVLLNLYGESGTGKTMAAEAVADRMDKNIIKATYADIESKWHGEGPQKLKAIFMAAQNQDAVLFIDEADSMLSSRLSSVSNGSEQAINSMRSQLLICLENFDGVVIFATNLIKNYDPAFLTRLICIEMKKPDAKARKMIWHNHLYPAEDAEIQLNIPSKGDWNIDLLAEKYDFVGRDIRNAVKKACITALVEKNDCVSQDHLIYACEAVQKQKDDLEKARKNGDAAGKKLTPEQEEKASEQIAKALINKAAAKKKDSVSESAEGVSNADANEG